MADIATWVSIISSHKEIITFYISRQHYNLATHKKL